MRRRPLFAAAVTATLAVSIAAATTAFGLASAVLWRPPPFDDAARLVRQDPGFALDHVFVADVGLPPATPLSAYQVDTAGRQVLVRIAALPSVRAAAAAYDHPLEANWSESFTLVGDVSAPDQSRPGELRIVSPEYFAALDVELLDGRVLAERDDVDAPGAVVVNEAPAREVGGRVLGRRIRSGGPRFSYGGAPRIRNRRHRGRRALAGARTVGLAGRLHEPAPNFRNRVFL